MIYCKWILMKSGIIPCSGALQTTHLCWHWIMAWLELGRVYGGMKLLLVASVAKSSYSDVGQKPNRRRKLWNFKIVSDLSAHCWLGPVYQVPLNQFADYVRQGRMPQDQVSFKCQCCCDPDKWKEIMAMVKLKSLLGNSMGTQKVREVRLRELGYQRKRILTGNKLLWRSSWSKSPCVVHFSPQLISFIVCFLCFFAKISLGPSQTGT